MNVKPGIKLLSDAEGAGPPIKGDRVTVKLNGWLNQGEVVLKDHVQVVLLGKRDIIAGLEYSIAGMRAGGKRKVKISPHLAYGAEGLPNKIPANAILIFEIEVIEFESAP